MFGSGHQSLHHSAWEDAASAEVRTVHLGHPFVCVVFERAFECLIARSEKTSSGDDDDDEGRMAQALLGEAMVTKFNNALQSEMLSVPIHEKQCMLRVFGKAIPLIAQVSFAFDDTRKKKKEETPESNSKTQAQYWSAPDDLSEVVARFKKLHWDPARMKDGRNDAEVIKTWLENVERFSRLAERGLKLTVGAAKGDLSDEEVWFHVIPRTEGEVSKERHMIPRNALMLIARFGSDLRWYASAFPKGAVTKMLCDTTTHLSGNSEMHNQSVTMNAMRSWSSKFVDPLSTTACAVLHAFAAVPFADCTAAIFSKSMKRDDRSPERIVSAQMLDDDDETLEVNGVAYPLEIKIVSKAAGKQSEITYERWYGRCMKSEFSGRPVRCDMPLREVTYTVSSTNGIQSETKTSLSIVSFSEVVQKTKQWRSFQMPGLVVKQEIVGDSAAYRSTIRMRSFHLQDSSDEHACVERFLQQEKKVRRPSDIAQQKDILIGKIIAATEELCGVKLPESSVTAYKTSYGSMDVGMLVTCLQSMKTQVDAKRDKEEMRARMQYSGAGATKEKMIRDAVALSQERWTLSGVNTDLAQMKKNDRLRYARLSMLELRDKILELKEAIRKLRRGRNDA
eukprot:g1631.t1